MEEMTARMMMVKCLACFFFVREAPILIFLPSHDDELFSLLLWVGQVSLEELCHTEGTNLVLSEDGDHLGVGGEVLLVLRVLQLVGLDVGPESLDHLGPGELLVLLRADEVSELLAEGQRLGESGSFGHLCSFV